MHTELNTKKTKEEIEEYQFKKYTQLGETIALLSADFKCEKCEMTKDLTFHHLIEKKNKHTTYFGKYFSQRNYFENIVILCKSHHLRYHGFFDDFSMTVISTDKINKLKKKNLTWLKKEAKK